MKNKKLLFLFFIFSILLFPDLRAQQKKKKAKKEYSLIFQSGDLQSGYGVTVHERKNKYGNYEYYIVEGNRVDGKLNGFGREFYFNSQETRIDFDNRTFDSASAVNEINLLPRFQVPTATDSGFIKLGSYYYYMGLCKEGVMVKGSFYNTDIKNSFKGLFGLNTAQLDFGSYTNQYRNDTVIKGFLWNPLLHNWSYTFCATGLRYYIADTFFKMVPYYEDQPVNDLYPFPMSEYNSKRQPVYNMPFNNGTYTGEAYNGKPEGLGEWYSDDGEYVGYGYFKNGVPHGLFCKNIQVRDYTTSEYIFFSSPKRPMKGVAMGIFKNGVPDKMYIDCGGLHYAGVVNENFQPHGIGKLERNGVKETGTFSFGRLDGYGTRISSDKSVTMGNFKYGQLTSGIYQQSVSSLQQYDVLLVNGKRLMVMEKIWSSMGTAYVKLNNGSVLSEGDKFEKYTGDDSDFYDVCQQCNGNGVLYQTSTYKLWVGSESTEHRTIERIGGKDYLRTSVELTPKYVDKTTTSKQTCISCSGKGRVLKLR